MCCSLGCCGRLYQGADWLYGTSSLRQFIILAPLTGSCVSVRAFCGCAGRRRTMNPILAGGADLGRLGPRHPATVRWPRDDSAGRVQRTPYCQRLFVFRGKQEDRIKVLWWDGTGSCLYSKRLEQGPTWIMTPLFSVSSVVPFSRSTRSLDELHRAGGRARNQPIARLQRPLLARVLVEQRARSILRIIWVFQPRIIIRLMDRARYAPPPNVC